MEVLSKNQIEILAYKVEYLVNNNWTHNLYVFDPIWNKEGIRKTEQEAKDYKNNRFDFDDPPDYWYTDFTLEQAFYRQLEEDDKQKSLKDDKESLEDKIKQLQENVDKLIVAFRALNRSSNIKYKSPYLPGKIKK
jgi:hypothetical protein